jgi:predicted DNA-binding antitoxin AbrB/MazE fold protein
MSQEIRAIYENGLFRPLDPVALPDHGMVSLVITHSTTDEIGAEAEILADQREALQVMFDEAAKLAVECPGDGFSGADHDAVLYGWTK